MLYSGFKNVVFFSGMFHAVRVAVPQDYPGESIAAIPWFIQWNDGGEIMTSPAAERPLNPHSPNRAAEQNGWKKTLSETLSAINIIPEKFNGRIVISFKDGGVSYLEKSETFK